MDSYYYMIETANKIESSYKAMEEDMLVLMNVRLTLESCKNVEQALDVMRKADCHQRLVRASVDIQKLINTFEKKKTNFADDFLGALEDFNERVGEARDFSVDVNSLLLKTIQKYDDCITTLKSMSVLFSPTYFAPYIEALGNDRKLVEQRIREEQQRLLEEFRNDQRVKDALDSMKNEVIKVQQILSDEVVKIGSLPGADREKAISQKLPYKIKKLTRAIPICYFFAQHPMWFFIILNDSKPFMKDFFAGKTNASDNDSKFYIFREDLKKLTLDQKKALFLMITTLIENFEALEKEYTEMSYSTNKLKLNDVKQFSDYLRKVISQESMLSTPPAPKPGNYNIDEPTIRACEVTSKSLVLSDNLQNSLPQQYRIDKLINLLDDHNLYVRTLTLDVTDKVVLDGALGNTGEEQTLKDCWDYLHLGRPVQNIILNDTPKQVDLMIKTLEKGQAILNVASNQTKLAYWLRTKHDSSTNLSSTVSQPAAATIPSNTSPLTTITSGSSVGGANAVSPVLPPTKSKLTFANSLAGALGSKLKTPGGGGSAAVKIGSPGMAPTVTAQDLIADIQFIRTTINQYAQSKSFNPTTVSPFSKYLMTLNTAFESRLQAIANNPVTDPRDITEVRLKSKIVKPIRAILENPAAFLEGILAEILTIETEIAQFRTDPNFSKYEADLTQAKQVLTTLRTRGNINLDDLQVIDDAYEKVKEVKSWSGL